jgi:membrane associated rhomboid family serine protease
MGIFNKNSKEPAGKKAEDGAKPPTKPKLKKEAPGHKAKDLAKQKKSVNAQNAAKASSSPKKRSSSTGKTAGREPLLKSGESTTRRPTAAVEPSEYKPPRIVDSIDDIIEKVDMDKYRTMNNGGDESLCRVLDQATLEPERYASPTQHPSPTKQVTRRIQPDNRTIQPPAIRQQQTPVSEMTSQSFESEYSTVIDQQPPSQTRLSRHQIASTSTVDSERFLNGDPEETVDSERFLSRDPEEKFWSEDYSVNVKQKIAFLCIGVSALQLAILLIQLTLCGVASVDVNPMIGPFPDAFSEWGGKNAYLMLEENQWFRLITPVFLHVGVLHLLANVFCQLETCAFFEREWGSCRWLTLYLISGVGCVATSSVANPDVIGVCSSGALMGLFGAKIAQVITFTTFELNNVAVYESVQLDQLGGVMCSAALVSILSFFTYIDWSGHMGGLVAGFLGGMFIFCKPIESTCTRMLWGMSGLGGLLGGGCYLAYLLLYETLPDEDLADVCQYFRNLYPEGYDCDCVWG